ncbi:MAG: hypothetical protein IPL99_13420 [Candidatus Competibacteraceae bacterium]|nr:hypothetical protein [Candidatus Competibacteraceae bacterium]
MPELTRPTPAELDSMSHAEKDALILGLFDVLARLNKLRELKARWKKRAGIRASLRRGWNKEGPERANRARSPGRSTRPSRRHPGNG